VPVAGEFAGEFAGELAGHRPVLYRLAITLSGLDDADDVVQDALARAWRKRAQFDPERGSLRSWLLAIVADQARSRWRRRRPVEERIRADALLLEPAGESGLDLRHQVALLPPRQRAAVVLHYFVDLPVEEVARLMSCSPGTVKSTLHDARERLARMLGESYVED
jgi:RNA polymerase sigma-70 factor (ECF subfamily)